MLPDWKLQFIAASPELAVKIWKQIKSENWTLQGMIFESFTVILECQSPGSCAPQL